MTAPKADIPNEKAGVGHSIAGPGRSAVEETDPQEKIDAGFAKDVMTQLCKAKNDKQFDRLILVAGPRMLGLLRAEMDASLQSVLLGEIPKDLSSQPVGAVATHLEALLAI